MLLIQTDGTIVYRFQFQRSQNTFVTMIMIHFKFNWTSKIQWRVSFFICFQTYADKRIVFLSLKLMSIILVYFHYCRLPRLKWSHFKSLSLNNCKLLSPPHWNEKDNTFVAQLNEYCRLLLIKRTIRRFSNPEHVAEEKRRIEMFVWNSGDFQSLADSFCCSGQ